MKYLEIITFINIIILFYVIYNLQRITQLEKFTTETTQTTEQQITSAVKRIYLADVEAIRLLSNFAIQLSQGGTTVPGNVTFTGQVIVNKLNILPAGTIMAWIGATNPTGWLICDGAEYNKTDYQELADFIGTTFGISTNTTKFKVPDYRGAFLRGARSGATSGYGSYAGQLNSRQNHATQTHTHQIDDPGHTHETKYEYPRGDSEKNGRENSFVGGDGLALFSDEVNPKITNITIKDSTTSVHPNETRPYNWSINWIIKF